MKDKHEERQLSLHFEASSWTHERSHGSEELQCDLHPKSALVIDLASHRSNLVCRLPKSDDHVQSLLLKALTRVRLF